MEEQFVFAARFASTTMGSIKKGSLQTAMNLQWFSYH
jgi:hypothetical protein